jgi:hypothetical protein
MPQVRKTYSLDEQTVKLIEMLAAERDTDNTSELIRLLVAEESLRCGLIDSTKELNVPDVNYRQKKSDTLTKLDKLEVSQTKMQHKVNDTTMMCYEIRDAVNTILNFLNADNADSADRNISEENIHECIAQAENNYNDKLRKLAIGKSNFGRK